MNRFQNMIWPIIIHPNRLLEEEPDNETEPLPIEIGFILQFGALSQPPINTVRPAP
jgi:hypothetical protein